MKFDEINFADLAIDIALDCNLLCTVWQWDAIIYVSRL